MRALLPACAALMVGGGRLASAQVLPVVAIDRQVYASFDVAHLAYDEHLPPPAISDAEHGWTPGFGIGGRWIVPLLGLPALYVGVDYHRQSGHVAYTGAYFDATEVPRRAQSGLDSDDVTGEVGHVVLLRPDLAVVPMLQFGYHHWTRGIARDEIERYSDEFGGAAVRLDHAVTPRLVASARLGIAGTIGPEVDVAFRGDRSLGLGSRPLYQAGGRVEYAATRHIHVFAAGNVDRFDYGISGRVPFTPGTRIHEPGSRTTELTLSVGAGYAF